MEYAFADLGQQVSGIRVEELSTASADVLVTCPICFVNLYKHEQTLKRRVWDMGEVLYHGLDDEGER